MREGRFVASLWRRGKRFEYNDASKAEIRRRQRRANAGFFSVLHTWSQKLSLHPHVHCVVPAGGLALDPTHWVRSRENFLPKPVLREIVRGKQVTFRWRDSAHHNEHRLMSLSLDKFLRGIYR
jgi:hypothetical protein